jgi:1-acyl-sn-glycerol-3-phosphate acyltransferase
LNTIEPVIFPSRGNLLAKIIFKLLGWQLLFNGLPSTRGIFVAYPHTSNLDFFIGILAKWASGIEANFLAKDSLFRIPLVGVWLKAIGGRPVIRSSPQGYVKDIAIEMARAPYFWLAITPEGTRKKTPGWRSGFYHLALETKFPVGFVYIDYKAKTIGVMDFLQMSGDVEKDLQAIRAIYNDKWGFYPENMAPITFWSPQKMT